MGCMNGSSVELYSTIRYETSVSFLSDHIYVVYTYVVPYSPGYFWVKSTQWRKNILLWYGTVPYSTVRSFLNFLKK